MCGRRPPPRRAADRKVLAEQARLSVGRSVCCSYPCYATLRRFLRPTRCRLRFVARLCRDCARPAIPQHNRGFPARAIPDTRHLNPSRSHPDPYNFHPQTRKRRDFTFRTITCVGACSTMSRCVVGALTKYGYQLCIITQADDRVRPAHVGIGPDTSDYFRTSFGSMSGVPLIL